MPEGPECHIIGNKLHKILGGTKLLSIEILGGRYQKHGNPSGYDEFTETGDEITIEEIKDLENSEIPIYLLEKALKVAGYDKNE